MPVEFLTPTQQAQYGHYTQPPSPQQLATYFHLDDVDRANLFSLNEDHTRLGFAVQLGTVRFLGTFLSDLSEVPAEVVGYVAQQLQIDTVLWSHYLNGRSQRRHRTWIRQWYEYEDFHTSLWVFRLLRRLYARAWLRAEAPLVLFDDATAWLVHHKILLPGATTLERLIARIIDRANKRLWDSLVKLLDQSQRQQLQALLEVEQNHRFSRLELLRRSAIKFSAPTIKHTLQRLEKVRSLGVNQLDLSHLPLGQLKALARHGLSAWAAALDDLSEQHQLAVLLATAQELEALIQDEVIDLVMLNIAEKFKDAEKAGLKARIQTLAKLDAAALQLCVACGFILDDQLAEQQLRPAVFKQVSKDELSQAVALITQEAASRPPHYYNWLGQSYRSLRLFLPQILGAITFKGTPVSADLLEAWRFLYQLDYAKPKPDMQDAPSQLVSNKAWRAVVFNAEMMIDRSYYTFCVLHHIVAALHRRDLFISPSLRWQDQRLQLLHGDSWEKMRSGVCTALGKTTNGEKEVKALAKQLDQRYRQVAKRFARNKAVSIKKEGDHERISLTRHKKVPESTALKQLRKRVYGLLPEIDLPDLLLEIHHLTGFADHFTHISENQARADDLPLSICAVLLAQACNVGLDDVVNPAIPALQRSRLLWVQHNYIRDETLTRANASLVASQHSIPLAQLWGGGEVAAADGQRFKVPLETRHAAPSWKYFGQGQGVTYFTFTSDQFSSFYGVVIPGAVKESLYILDGLLEQQTLLEPTEIMTDTAGYTDLVFGLFWLLGYQFSPRLKDIGKTRFWRINKKARYGALNPIARHQINPQLIIDNWDDLLRVAGSLHLGKLSASTLMKTFQASKGSSALAKAIAEVGRIAKTMYLLNYIDDDTYRRRILIHLNRAEQRHSLARALFHGRRGQLWQTYRQGQEDQLGALGLVVNIIVLWNTLYMNKAIDALKADGHPCHEADIKRITPLGFDHIRLTGRYDFTLTANPEPEGLRPLRHA